MRNKIYSIILTSLAHFSKIATSFFILKFISVYLGVGGVGFLANYMSLVAAVLLLTGGGISNCVVKYSSIYKEDKENLNRFLISSSLYSLTACFFVLIVFLLFARNISNYIFDGEYIDVIYFLAIAQFLIAFVNFYFSWINGLGCTRKYFFLQISSFVIGVPVAWFLIKFFEIRGSAYALVIIYITPLIGIIFSLPRFKKIEFKLIDFSWWRKIYPFSLMAVVSFFSVPVVEILIRICILRNSNYIDVGLWQASMRLSSAYLGFFFIFLSYIFIPKVSILKYRLDILKEIFGMIGFVWIVFLIGAIFLFLNIEFFIGFFLSADFIEIKNYIKYQLFGDFFRVAIFVIGYFFVAKSNVKIYVFIEIFQYLNFYLLSNFLIYIFDNALRAVMMSYSIAFCISFFLCVILFFLSTKKGGDYE